MIEQGLADGSPQQAVAALEPLAKMIDDQTAKARDRNQCNAKAEEVPA
jgi:hypothetical protein